MCTGSVVQVSSVLTENILMSGTTSSLILASLIPSMLMVEWSTEAVLLLFKQLVQDCATTIPTPVSECLYKNSILKLCAVPLLTWYARSSEICKILSFLKFDVDIYLFTCKRALVTINFFLFFARAATSRLL